MTEANWNIQARIDAISSRFSFVTHLLDEAKVRAGWDEFCEYVCEYIKQLYDDDKLLAEELNEIWGKL